MKGRKMTKWINNDTDFHLGNTKFTVDLNRSEIDWEVNIQSSGNLLNNTEKYTKNRKEEES